MPCLSQSSPSVFAIDNLDSALNPRLVTRLVSRLAEWLHAANPDRQLLFTAHNPAVLDGLDLDDQEVRLFAVERNSQGHTTVRRIEVSPELQSLNEQYPLSRLWAMGHLGAVPNATSLLEGAAREVEGATAWRRRPGHPANLPGG